MKFIFTDVFRNQEKSIAVFIVCSNVRFIYHYFVLCIETIQRFKYERNCDKSSLLNNKQSFLFFDRGFV